MTIRMYSTSYTHLYVDLLVLHQKHLLNPELALSLITPDWNGVVVLDMYMPKCTAWMC